MVKRKLDGAVDESSEKFVNHGTQLYITCKKSVGLHLAEPSLMAGRLVGWPANKIWARLEI